MKANTQVVEHLQLLLNNELMARDQYLAHASILKDWGLDAIAERMFHESEEEGEHAQALIDRMLFLEVTPNMNSASPTRVGSTIVEMFEFDLVVEREVAALLKQAISVCETSADYVTREILVKLLDDTEMDHMYWLEQQLRLIKMVGLANFIQSQMTAKPAAE
ncbi:bacterioferritin [Umboniibacter marinipuniceus]|uniref:Bacterioferritin n=1 Tax=Umboniibacter marinipuniceus TaxID=569599 RepID=A0A3M0A917_9GAMM|nr:bacterioferritin [Umboniibacter marinipuniceus]RMA79999.1 bacterioferritin [Umboniibacter marinipuniceus]